ncbi:Clavaminate synthase-like protein [Multifurca ochricompacta]|uniref:Clavaminate synthase-like protein n=1 Tax=Multifurca ochricompacta TaxID=376703 RepID=A0AAD4M8N5_9AGAM|nr:Clavaminate synthase-like protein [Multifurca ochricompacta]
MPAIALPPVPHWTSIEPTGEKLEWAELEVIDLARAKTTEGRTEQVEKARNAMHNQGFFYVVNHGLDKAQVERIFDIAAVPFEQVGSEEKKHFEARIKETGSFMGYKPLQYWHIANGVRDRIEHYNFNRNVNSKPHPDALRPFLPEIQEFVRHNHMNVLHEVARLLTLGLELPEETLVNIHNYEERITHILPATTRRRKQTGNVWMKGHEDQTSLSILYSQPISALQIRDVDSKWRWVKHIENALVINCGRTLEMLSGGYYRSAIHRVVQPPQDQRGNRRLGVFYFCYADDDVQLEPLSASPVLQRVGIKRRMEEGKAPLSGPWREAYIAAYGTSELEKGAEEGIEEEELHGIRVKHYN